MRISPARIRLPQRQPRPTGPARWRAGGVLPLRSEAQTRGEVVGDVHGCRRLRLVEACAAKLIQSLDSFTESGMRSFKLSHRLALQNWRIQVNLH